MQPMSRFFDLYGNAPPELQLENNRSGLTPVSPVHPYLWFMGARNEEGRQRAENYQKGKFKGFTSRMLSDADAITSREMRGSTLDNPIHPILERTQWRTYPDDDGENHYWSADSDDVWDAMQPSLRLVTQILAHIHKHPWFDALLLGELQSIGEGRFSEMDLLENDLAELQQRYKAFRLRSPDPANMKTCQETLNDLISSVMYRYLRLDIRVEPDASDVSFGETTLLPDNIILITISKELVSAVMGSGPADPRNMAARMGDQFALAATLLHELMYSFCAAMDCFIDGQFVGMEDAHPITRYFMEEQVGHVGYSCENAIFGGRIMPFISKSTRPRSYLGMFLMTWPESADRPATGDPPHLVDPPLVTPIVALPLPVTYYQALFSQEFWDAHFRKVGTFRPPPLVAATFKARSETDDHWQVIVGTEFRIKDYIRMTKVERMAHLAAMNALQAQNFHSLIRERNKQVPQVIADRELLQSMKTLDEAVIDAMRARLARSTEALVKVHQKLVCLLPALEGEGGVSFQDTRNALQSFNRNLRKFIHSSQVFDDSEYEKEMVRLMVITSKTRMKLADPSEMIVPTAEGKRKLANSNGNAVVANKTGIYTDAEVAESTLDELEDVRTLEAAITGFNKGTSRNSKECARLCNNLIGTMGSCWYIKAYAQVMMGHLTTLSKSNRRRYLGKALNKLHMLTPQDDKWRTHIEGLVRLAELQRNRI